MQRAKSVDEYLEIHAEWSAELSKLRGILTASELEEEVKWGAPCYTLSGKNVVGLGAFQQHVALWFHQGVYLQDKDGVLINAQEGTTKALRQWRFRRARDIPVRRVTAYVREAIENQRQGRALRPQAKKAIALPPELRRALRGRAAAERAFAALTPGRRREYAEYVASAKRAETKASRVAKVLPMIEAGFGLNDRYRDC